MNESEADFESWVVGLAQRMGWRRAGFRPARVIRRGQEIYETPVKYEGKGWPDLVLVRERVLWRELKAETGRLTEQQMAWLAALTAAGQDAGVWRPGDRETIEKELE